MKVCLGVFLLSMTVAAPAAAQSAKPMPLEQLAAYNKPDREKVLYAGAKVEGKATWYTSLAGDSYKQLAAAFEARYPGVKVESYRATRQEMSARVMAEAQSKRYIADTFETTIPLLKLLKENKMLVPYYFPTQAKYPDNVKEKRTQGSILLGHRPRVAHRPGLQQESRFLEHRAEKLSGTPAPGAQGQDRPCGKRHRRYRCRRTAKIQG
jgi:hypothetical protein